MVGVGYSLWSRMNNRSIFNHKQNYFDITGKADEYMDLIE
jgi:hypothetical protein